MSDRVTIQVNGLTSKVRAAIADSGEPDANAIAESLFADVDEQDLKAGLKLVVERTAGAMRREALQRAEREANLSRADELAREHKQNAESQLAEIRATHQEMVAERFFMSWKETPTGRKFFGECTATDLRWSGARYEQRSAHAHEAAARDNGLADALDKAGARTVRDLGYHAASQTLANSRVPK